MLQANNALKALFLRINAKLKPPSSFMLNQDALCPCAESRVPNCNSSIKPNFLSKKYFQGIMPHEYWGDLILTR